MSAAAAATADAAPPPKAGKKRLLIIVAAVLLLVLGGGGAAYMVMHKKAAAEEGAEEDGEGAAAHAPKHAAAKAPALKLRDAAHPPAFVPLDPFTVNLADRDADRYAQIAVTLELDDPKTADALKAFMPAIRNNILMVISSRTAATLLSREGKDRMSAAILRAAVQPLGYPVEIEDEEDVEDPAAAPRRKKKRAPAMQLPVTAVHYSTFIVQ